MKFWPLNVQKPFTDKVLTHGLGHHALDQDLQLSPLISSVNSLFFLVYLFIIGILRTPLEVDENSMEVTVTVMCVHTDHRHLESRHQACQVTPQDVLATHGQE